jgi:hypothetical protein
MDSFSIFSNNPPGALGVESITIKGSDLAMYLSDTCLTSSCSFFLKKSPSSIRINLGLVNERKASMCVSMLQPFSSSTVSFESNETLAFQTMLYEFDSNILVRSCDNAHLRFFVVIITNAEPSHKP